MGTKEIINALRMKKGGNKWERSLRMTVVYSLYKKGYEMSHIAIAFNVHVKTIKYECKTIENLVDVEDKLVEDAMSLISTHLLEIKPYFVHENGMYRTKTYLIIDNKKL